MINISLYNLGSFATDILTIVPGISSTLSGALPSIVNRERLFVENYTGATIGSVAIAEKYQPAIMSRSLYKVYGLMQAEGSDSSNIHLGDFSVSKGGGSNLTEAMNMAKQQAEEELQILGFGTRFYKANG